jgi:hypothetical protein
VATPEAEPVSTFTPSTKNLQSNWSAILDAVAKVSRPAWAAAFTSKVVDYSDGVLTLLFQSEKDVDTFKNSGGAAEVLRQVIFEHSGVRVKYRARVADASAAEPKSSKFSAAASAATVAVATADPTPITQQQAEAALADDPEEVALTRPINPELEAAQADTSAPEEAVTEETDLLAQLENLSGDTAEPETATEQIVNESILRDLLGAEPMDDVDD